ncbi:class I adenylate-forming enzyme family protein [Streptomyces sp. NPDC001678]|uniref:class I adenylate-forming enzyme family protein n=1 Tax=Streptomyces sp. NPDC001678 TaxID=3364599 RepID=UPI00369F5C7C
MLASTAAAFPDRVAVVGGGHRWTYAGLDAAATACARALRPLVAPGTPVAVSSFPHPAFLAGYYGAVRAGAVVLPLNPLLPDAAVERVLEQSGAGVALVTPEVYDRVRGMRGRLPRLARLHPWWGEDAAVPLTDTTAAAWEAPSPSPGEEDIAAVMFTSGTTGPSKGVAVSHRAVRVNAAQFGRCHHMDAASVVLCHLPIVSPMHMNAAVRAGACQVLCPSPDIMTSVRLANEHRATHYYSLPVRLARLATDPDLARLSLESVSMIAAGNQTLAPRIVSGLSQRFGVPVFQGYGLTESAHLAHTDGPVHPRPGSCGPPVPGSESRIVDIDTAEVLAPGEVGELQVRGPQLMSGYTNRPELRPFDEEGWFATGDVGSLDEEGYLYVLDRLVDVFRHEGMLVSPSLIERLLQEHPEVAEAAVADRADGEQGRAPVAFLVLTEPAPVDREKTVTAVLESVNAVLEPHERLRDAVVVPAVPRSATNGKVDRKALRAGLCDGPATITV